MSLWTHQQHMYLFISIDQNWFWPQQVAYETLTAEEQKQPNIYTK